ncbi:MAG: DUF2637 domain-containing protein [Longispora sp.]|nr:DUF2637 domain-containing protein [Longispora sp. (in: high G+C Gram-positive bacteria)]
MSNDNSTAVAAATTAALAGSAAIDLAAAAVPPVSNGSRQSKRQHEQQDLLPGGSDGAAVAAATADAAAARLAYRQSLAAELSLSGKTLAMMFGRSESWGRTRIREVKAEETTAEFSQVTAFAPRQSIGNEVDVDAALPQNGSTVKLLPQNGSAHSSTGALLPVLPLDASHSDAQARRQDRLPRSDSSSTVAGAPAAAAATTAAGRQPDGSGVGQAALRVVAGLVSIVGTLGVAVAGFALSFDAIRTVGMASGVRVSIAWLLPVSVDGAMLVATVATVVMHRLTGKRAYYAWAVLLLGAGVSIACNMLHAHPVGGHGIALSQTTAGLVSAIPAVMLALAAHLLTTLLNTSTPVTR